MLIYVIYLLIILYLAYHYDVRGCEKYKERWQFVVVFLLIALAGLRNHVGGDTANYERHFIEAPLLSQLSSYELTLTEQIEFLWFYFFVIVKSLFKEFYVVQIIHALITNILIFRFIKRNTPYFFIATLVFFIVEWWNFNFEIMRESLCIAIFLNGLLFLQNKKPGKYILSCIPAFFIHYFAFVPILSTLALYYCNKRISVVIVLFFSVFFLLYGSTIADSILSFALNVTAGENSQTYESYITGELYGQTSLNLFGYLKHFIILACPVILAYIFYKRDDEFSYKIVVLYILFYVAFIVFPVFSRFSHYLFVCFVLYGINYIKESQMNLFKHYTKIIIIYLCVSACVNFYKPATSAYFNQTKDIRYFPYKSIFQDVDIERESIYYR